MCDELSKGSVLVDVRWNAGLEYVDGEEAIAKQVRAGDLDLGWVGSRAFDTLGVSSLRAVQAPFLITDNRLTKAVAQDEVAAAMLSDLSKAALVGLGLYPDQLRHPVGFRKPLASISAFKGARIRTLTSNTSDAVLRALGAEPVHLKGSAYRAAIDDHTLDGVDASLGLAPSLGGAFLTGNVSIFPRMNVLFSSESALDQLDEPQRAALSRAAADTLAHSVESLPDADDPTPFCRGGGAVVTVTPAQLDAMRAAVRPVYTELESDPGTKRAIDRIRALARRFRPAPTTGSCGDPPPAPPGSGTHVVPDGTYTAVATKADALRLGTKNDDCAVKAEGAQLRLTLADGEFTQWEKCSILPDQIGSQGRFKVTSDTFTTIESCCGETYLDWSFDGRFLTLRLRALEKRGPGGPGRAADHGAPVGEDRLSTPGAFVGSDCPSSGTSAESRVPPERRVSQVQDPTVGGHAVGQPAKPGPTGQPRDRCADAVIGYLDREQATAGADGEHDRLRVRVLGRIRQTLGAHEVRDFA